MPGPRTCRPAANGEVFMPKKPKDDAAQAEDGRTPAQQTLGGAAGMLILVGGLAVVMDIMGGEDGATWLRYFGILTLLGGGVCWYFSDMPRQQTLEWVKSGVFALTLALMIRWPIAEPYRIPSGSMEPTLHGDPAMGKGDRVFVNKWIYGVRWPFLNQRIWYGKDPERWDLVVFKSNEPNAEHPTLVKRIVGMPNEHIQIREGRIYADGEALELPEFMPEVYYTAPRTAAMEMRYGILPEPEYSEIPDGHYLLLGDNSANSRDGRVFGWMPNEHLVGRVSCIWWPPPRLRDFTGFTASWWWNGGLLLIGLLILGRLFVGRSWPVLGRDGRVHHLAVGFLPLGIRIPFAGKWIVRWGNPERNDCVLYRVDHENLPPDAYLVGRIVGLPGETVSIEAEGVRINGEAFTAEWMDEHNYVLAGQAAPYGRKKNKSEVPDGAYFILSEVAQDDDALDSRVTGWVPATALGGKVLGTWWPLRR